LTGDPDPAYRPPMRARRALLRQEAIERTWNCAFAHVKLGQAEVI
jgi:hypothetical protein